MKKILLVEDDESLGFVTKDNLEIKGYIVTLCTDGGMAIEQFHSQQYDLCILDVMLPIKDGFEVARTIRKSNEHIPIIFLTAKALQADKLIGFEIGGDDYLTKPFSIEELIYRIEVFLKRSGENSTSTDLSIGDYLLNLNSYVLEHHSKAPQKLTKREAEILHYLLKKKNELVKREEILIALWGEDDYFKGRSLDVFISKIRKYLQNDSSVDIENYHGIGFKLTVGHKP